MINFNDPKKWIILQYRPGTGGKFFSACLMTIEKISHWDFRVENKEITFKEWVNTQWNYDTPSKWIAYEPLHDWNTTFFSRTFPRGNDVSIDEYNKSMNSYASDYLKQIWATDKLVLDFINKENFPAWWRDSFHVTLDAQEKCPVHKDFLLSKIYPYDENTKLGTSMMDKPLEENKYQNARVFANQFEFGPFDTCDDWYNFIWKNDFRLNFNLSHCNLLLDDLIDYQKLKSHISKIAKELNSEFDESDLEYLFKYWIKKKIDIC
jgi:hypothetical protein